MPVPQPPRRHRPLGQPPAADVAVRAAALTGAQADANRRPDHPTFNSAV